MLKERNNIEMKLDNLKTEAQAVCRHDWGHLLTFGQVFKHSCKQSCQELCLPSRLAALHLHSVLADMYYLALILCYAVEMSC